jgi:uncharacterized coiled-coil protein SlyX
MKTIFLTLGICFLVSAFSMVSVAQTPDDPPKVCISQEAANKCVTAAAELIEARKVIEGFQKERALSIAEREAAAVLVKGLNDLIAVKDRIDQQKDQVIALYEKVIAMQQGIIDQLEKRLNRPKSGFAKFMDALKAVGYILVGVTLGRGF